MRIRLTLDDGLVAKARAITGLTETSDVINAALKALIAREAGRRLIRLGGTEPAPEDIRRRRTDDE
jgi:Arc/MetJ family transcription regulator